MNRLMEWVFRGCAYLSVVTVVGIFIFLLKESLPIFHEVKVSEFFTSTNWNPTGWEGEHYGMLALLWGTMFVTLVTLVISVPIGVICAIFLAEIAPDKLRVFLKPTIELIAGIPSVVIGFFGIVFLGPMIAKIFHIGSGLTVLNGSILLSFMVLPTIISLSEDAISAVPKEYRYASLAMGSSRMDAILKVVLPAAKSGIFAAIMLGMGRAIGETMTVLMVCGNTPAIAQTILSPVRTLTATIAIEMGEVAYDTNAYYALFNLGLYLLIISFLINHVAEYFVRKGSRA